MLVLYIGIIIRCMGDTDIIMLKKEVFYRV